ncbi:MAG: papain-like cysteine protease family protein [Nanoarchaeota archaeon]|nr:papain-like cysteine protease family protein [Nanoarchaeota archaeon]
MNYIKNREQEYKLKIPLYRQTLPTSCGSTCMLMVGNYFFPKKFFLNTDQEKKIHELFRFWKNGEGGDFENMAKILSFARKKGFKVSYFLDGPRGKPKEINENLWRRYLKLFLGTLKKEEAKGLRIIKHFNPEDLLAEIVQGRPLLCEVKFKEGVTHMVVLRGFKNNVVYLIDPLIGYCHMLREDFFKSLNLGYMKNAFSITPLKKV